MRTKAQGEIRNTRSIALKVDLLTSLPSFIPRLCYLQSELILATSVFNKLVITALKFAPVVIAHHLPFKTLQDGRMFVYPLDTLPNLTGLIEDYRSPKPRINRSTDWYSHISPHFFILSGPCRPLRRVYRVMRMRADCCLWRLGRAPSYFLG